MKIFIKNNKIYIKEDKYTNATFQLTNYELIIYNTSSYYEYYKNLCKDEMTLKKFLKNKEKLEKERQYYSEDDLLKQENEEDLYYVYKCIKKQLNATVKQNTYIQAKRIVTIILLLILIKNEKIKIKLQEIIEKKENVKVNFEEMIKSEFKNIKMYKSSSNELLIGDLQSKKIIIVANSSILLRNYTHDKIKEIEYYELFFNNTKTNDIWKLYRLLMSKINITRHDANHCLMGVYLLIFLLQNEEFCQIIENVKKQTKYKGDKEILEKYKDLLYI